MKKRKNLNGFILVETMVVIVFLATTLLTVYSSFTTVLDNAKTRIFYDDPIYLYRTYYFLSYLEKNNLTDFIDAKFANTSGTDNRSLSIVEFGCSALSVTEESGGAGENGFCESLKSSMDINHVFIMNYDVNEVIKCDEQSGNLDDKTLYCQRNKALQNLSISAVNYLYTLDGYTGSSTPEAVKASGYRIVMEFRKAKTATYEYFDYNKSTTNKETMQETTYNYYYTTLKVPYGYDNRSKTDPILRRTYQDDTYAYKDSAYAEKIKTLTFNTSWSDTSDAVKVWDVGVEPGTVQAYIKNSPTYSGYYDLYIEGNGKLYANTDSSYLIYSLTELEEINNLVLFDTSYTTNMSYMFCVGRWDDSPLTSLDLSGFDTSNVTDMSYMFKKTSYLTSLDLSNFNTANVINMEGMFYYNDNLTNLNISTFNTSKVTNMSHMFYFNRSLTSLDLSNFDTRNVTDMSSMFGWCRHLTSLNVTSFNTSKVTDMGYMFDLCESLTNLNLNSFNTSKVTLMNDMFSNCQKLTDLNISSFNTSNVTDMSGMFYSDKSLTVLNLYNFDTKNVTNMASMFYYCRSLTSLNVSSFNTSKVTNMYQMFAELYSITNLDVSNFDTHNVTVMSAMFQDCSKLLFLDLSNFDTSNVEDMGASKFVYFNDDGSLGGGAGGGGGGMFEGCSSLKSLDLSNFDTRNVTNMNSMFEDCSGLVSLDISNFNTQSVTDMTVMFYRTSNLTDYKLPVFDVRSVTEMRGMFGKSKINYVKMNRANFNSSAKVTPLVLKYQQFHLVVRSSQDKALFGNLSNTRLNITVSTN